MNQDYRRKRAREHLAAAVLFLERRLHSNCVCGPEKLTSGTAKCHLCRLRQDLTSSQATLADPASTEELLHQHFEELKPSLAWLTGIDQEEVASTIQAHADTIQEERRVVLTFDDIDQHDFSCTCSLHNSAYKSFGVGIFSLPRDYDPEDESDEMADLLGDATFHGDPLDRVYAESDRLAERSARLLCKGMGGGIVVGTARGLVIIVVNIVSRGVANERIENMVRSYGL